MNMPLLRARQTKYWVYTIFYAAVVLAVLVVANILADRYNKTYDATSNKRYSLSAQTAKIVKELKQPATITYYDVPKNFSQARDQLERYSNLSSRVQVKYADVEKEPELARAAGVKTAGTAVVQVGDRKEEAKSLTEEGITGAFIRDIKSSTRTVCFAEGSGEHRIDDSDRSGFSRFKDLLGKDGYEAKVANLVAKAEVPADCTVLVVGGPSSDYQQPEVDALAKYVEGGGRALFLLDPPLKFGRSPIADNQALTTLLGNWGVTAEKNLILDFNPISQIAGLGADVALVADYDAHQIVDDLKRTMTGFPLARSLDTKNGDKTTVQKLFSTSDSSMATNKLDSPNVNLHDPQNVKGPLTLGAAGTYNTGKDNAQGRFVVVGSSDWAANSFINFNGNRDLALNAVNWLASDEDLISIRPQQPDDRRITLTQAQMSWLRITSQFLLPLLVIVGGVSVWWRRR